MNTTRVLALLPLFAVLAHSFSWDIVEGIGKRLKFYKNRTLIHTENNVSSKEIHAVVYDPVHYRVLFSECNKTTFIYSFDLTTRKIQTLVKRETKATHNHLAYDPLTQLLFWTEGDKIYSISLKSASSDKAVDGNLVVTTQTGCRAIAVDSCGGYIYWITDKIIERAALDGSEREVLIGSSVYWRTSFAIDQQTQKMYWIELLNIENGNYPLYILYADLNGKNVKTLLFEYSKNGAYSLAISNDSIYWKKYDAKAILQLPKNKQPDVKPIVYTSSNPDCWYCYVIAANYTILEQTRGTKVCEDLKSLIPKAPVSNTSDVGLLNVTKINEESCSTCQHYCFQGNCSVSAEGHPKCSCEAGYSGERCEVNTCYKHCLHGGVCSLNEEDEPFCQCTAAYKGERCDVATSFTGVHADDATQEMLRDLRREANKVKEELKHALQFFSHKIDEYEAKFQ